MRRRFARAAVRMALGLVLVTLVTACSAGTTTPPGGTAVPSPAPTVATSRDVTLDDDGKVINLHVGDTFLLRLGEEFTWEVVVDDQAIISRVPNILVVRGAQGVYAAHKAGTTVMRATGDPACRMATPPCAAPSRLFQVTLVVQ